MIKISEIKIKRKKSSKKRKISQILAITIISIILIADLTKLGLTVDFEIDLDASPTPADVGENILFNWTMNGQFSNSWINFGDGNLTIITAENSSMYHKYSTEGKYNVTLYAKQGQTDATDWILVEIKNEAPQFNISLVSEAYEDENITISVIDLVESDHDKIEGIITYVYDFADGEQVSSNQSSCIHNWKNAGVYPVTITVIDDQGALDQKSQDIEINNKNPNAMFTIDADIPPEQLRSSYYAIYDFRQDIIDSEPKYWDVHDSSSEGDEKTAKIKPNEDHLTNWDPSGSHYSRIDETTPDGTTIYTSIDNRVDEIGFTTFSDDVNITELNFYIYGKVISDFAISYIYLSWRIGGGSYSTEQIMTFDFSYSWKMVTWSCDLNKAQLDNLRLKVKSYHVGSPEDRRIDIDTLYCEFVHQPNTTVSVVDVGGNYKEVVQLYDKDTEEQIWMENTFADQQYGTVEFYVKTTNTSSITWAMSLWDSSTSLLAFQVLIANNVWKYDTGTSSTISELGTPLNNTWYWLRIDFCVSGSYLNLSSLQFRITANDTTSNIYNFSSVNKVNKIRFESALQDKGIAWIDAIGYSFDPHYTCGDNKIPLISYPEKSYVLFSAANCTDTESDISSLRFYWQFGDNSSGFGKYVYHNYLSSGRYVVNLTCKDDNGAIDSHFEIVLIHNAYPALNLTISTEIITIREGETITFTAETLDDSTDMARLSYWWQFDGSGLNPYNLSNCISGGWRNSNLFTGDFNDSIYLLVKDPEGAFDYDSVKVTVLNVDPLISIWDTSVIANISFEVYRNSPSKNANFTFQLMEDDVISLEKLVNFTGSQDTIVYSDEESISMTLSKNWKVVINSTDELPENSWFRCYVRLHFLSGEELVISSNKLYGGSYGYWDVDINPYFFDNGDLTFMYPITFWAQIWDPSIDDISLNLQYSVEMLLEINCSDTLPISDSFTIEYPLNDANYTVSIYEEGGIKYANITATQLILSEIYDNNSFPVNLDVPFTIYPIIDLFEILEVRLNLSEVSILKCISAFNFLNASVFDDDFGMGKLDILFNTCDGIEFKNLSPKLEPFVPNIAAEGNNVTFYVKASDFDQISDLDKFYTASFKSDVVPLNSDAFMMINGTLYELGDLRFQDGNSTVFNSDFTISNPTIPSQPSDFTLNSGTSDWYGDFYCIDNNYTTFSSNEKVSSIPEYIDSITYTKGLSGPGTLENTHNDDSNYKQINAKGKYYGNPIFDYLYELEVTFNFDPSFAGGDFYLSCDIVTSGGRTGYLKVNGQTKSLGGTIDFDDMLIEDVTSITFNTNTKWFDSFDSKIYYFKLKPIINELNFTSTITVESPNSTYLFYSYATNITQSIDMKVWNYSANQWVIVETSNYDTFSEQIFALNDDYYNENNEILISYYGVNLESPFSLRLDMLKVVLGTFTLNFTSTLQMDNINDVEILKYLKFIYAYKTDSPQLINISLYNFQTESWELIDSHVVGADIYRNKHSILSSEYYNETYNIIFKVESNAVKLYLDQLKLEYYSAHISDCASFEFENVPETSEDFTLLSGTCDWDGDLRDQDDDYITFTSQTKELNFTSEIRLRGVRPDDYFNSIELLWSFKTNISQSINVLIYDYDTSSWTLINTSICIGFSNNSYSIINNSYYGPYYIVRVKFDGGGSSEFELYLDKLKVHYSWIKNSYQEDYLYENFPDQPDDFISTAGIFPATRYITSITYTKGSSGGGSLSNTHNDDSNYKQINAEGTYYGNPIFDYNYELEVTFNFDPSLAGRDFYLSFDIVTSGGQTGYLKVNGQTVSSGTTIDFDDMLIEDVTSITFNTNTKWFDSFNSKIYYFKLVEAIEGNLQKQGEGYITFTSNSEYKINFTTQFELFGVQLGDTIDLLNLNYSCKTNISQLINLSIYNFTASDWLLIESSVHLSFFNGSYSIPITRVETSGNETIEYHDFYDSNFKIRVKVEGSNSTSSFQLFLDQLKIEYMYTSYFFKSNYWLFFDAIEEDYTIFDSTIEYLGTYSFDKDDIGAKGTAVSFIDDYEDPGADPPGDGTAYSKVIAELDGHNTVLKNFDNNVYIGSYCFKASHIFPTNIEYGTVELWVYKKDVDYYDDDVGCPFLFRNINNETLFAFNMDKSNDGLVRFTSEEGDDTWSGLYADDTWFHVRLDFETRDGGNYLGLEQYTLNLWFDGVKKLDGVGFYKNATINHIYWYSSGFAKKAHYYFDAIAFSWDQNYEVGQNKDPNSLVSELFDLELRDMDSVKYALFTGAELSYSFKTNITQEITVRLYNYSSQAYVEIDTIITDDNPLYNATYWFKSTDFINSDYICKAQIIGNNNLLDNFELHLSQLELKYTWGGGVCDLGQYDVVHELGINLEMTSKYSTMFQKDFVFDAEGLYLITTTADDGYSITKNGTVIEIRNFNPTASIGNFPNQTIEDKKVYFTSEVQVFGSNSTQSDLRYFWSFGDGLYSFEVNPVHAWSESGVYNISLTIVDCYANIYTDVKNITILEKAPEIQGPFTFQGVESQSIDLDVSIFDAFKDELNVEYEWYNSTGLFSTDKKPSVILHDGSYDYILNVTDSMGQTATANISVVVEDVSPVVLISNYMYSGANSSGDEGFFIGSASGNGELELKAYGYDNFEDSDFDYYWTIFKGNKNYTRIDYDSGICSNVKFRVSESAQYRGLVEIVSGNKSSVASFMLNSVIDSNGNGIGDEMEEMILEFYDNVTAYSDTDDDGLTDLYELGIINTSYLNPDTDGDGLWDGLHNVTGIGEQTLWTEANDPDCDNDLLTDGTEVFGWNITSELYGQIVVSSNPWKSDTDGDGLSDYDEYYASTDPRDTDTDNDGLNDFSDPYPTKWDYDGDGLSDKVEQDLGTSLNQSDTDGDGLTDGEEVFGWGFKTDPLTADSDHDFAADNAEMKSHRAQIDDRYDLDESVEISFEVNCEKAASAQIAFMITFGEAINEPENDKVYGVQEVPEINISIYKVDDNLLIFNKTSAEFNQTGTDSMTRYLSQVVDIRDIIENLNLNYRGQYSIMINDTDAGCMLEQFEIEIAGYLHPKVSDYDNDGIMDGVEMGLLVEGTYTIDYKDIYGDSATIEFPREEIGWWRLDEGTGTTVSDSSLYENDGTLNNMEAADWKTGKIGDYSLEFDGIDEYINCGDNSYLNFERNQTYTLSAWVKTSSANGSILSKMNVSDSYKGYDMYCKSDGVIRAHLINTLNSNEIIVDGSTQIDDGEWHFVVISYNGSSSASGVKIFIDGSLDNLTTVKDTLNKTIQTNVDFTIGSRTGDNYYSEQIDDVRVYYNDLNQDEITWLNNSGNGRSLKTLNITTENYIETQYNIEIPHVGRVYDANLTLKVESISTPIGSGNITIELLKEEISNKIDDVVLIDYFSEFDNTTAFTYENFLDLSDYLNNGSIYQYYGKFILNIELHGTYLFDKFNVSEFFIESDTFIQAGTSDTEGWITDPATADTDNDGWSDYYEIFTKSTNPICADTDGDGVWDPYDRDPKRDVMLKISPISGAAPGKYKLVIVTVFSLSGTGDDYYIPTPKVTAHEYESSLWTAYLDGTHGSSTELHYYANIDDDKRIQANNLDFTIQLWRVDRYMRILGIKIKKWDKELVNELDTYHINNIGNSEILNATKYDDSMNKIYEAKVKVETIGVEKANTIAIYETNDTVFNGHYQEQEKMNIIQLYINDGGTGTPFEEGLNTIVIPTRLFTETIFNAHVQNETLSDTPIYSSDEEKFKFISVGRDGNTEQACDEIDFIIIRFDISSEDAMEVLELLLTCLVNETTNETAVVYSYVSTKLNGTSAVMMNLPISVIQLIPWSCDFSDSPMGSKPETFEDWFWKPLSSLSAVLIGVIITIGMAIVALVMLIVDFVVEIFMNVLPILGYILWLIIRVLILIFIWILFVISLILVVVGFLVILVTISILNISLNANTTIKFNSIIIQKQDLTVELGYNIEKRHCEFLSFDIPVVLFYFKKGNTTIEIPFSYLGEISIPKFDLQKDFYDHTNISQSQPSNSGSNSSDYGNDVLEMINGATMIMSLYGAGMGLIGIVINFPSPNEFWNTVLAYVALALWSFSLFSLISYSLDHDQSSVHYLSDEFVIGAAIGFFISGLFAASVTNKLTTAHTLILIMPPIVSKIFSIVGKIFNGIGKFFPEEFNIFTISNIIFAFFSLIFGWIALRGIGAGISNTRDTVATILMFIAFGLSFFCLFYPIFRHLD